MDNVPELIGQNCKEREGRSVFKFEGAEQYVKENCPYNIVNDSGTVYNI